MKVKNIILLFFAAALLCGCDSFLDRQPDKALNFKDVFKTKIEAEYYLNNVYGFMPNYYYPSGYNSAADGWPQLTFSTADEAKLSYNRDYNIVNNGAMNPSNIPYNRYNFFYQGIREANIFIANIDQCEELVNANLTDQYKDEARFCRAFYYYMLLRQWGPVSLVYDEIIPESNEYNMPRNTWDDCVNYVVGELTKLSNPATSFLLRNPGTSDKGRATQGAAMGLKAMLLLYSASPLFNPINPSTYIYKDIKNHDGTKLFPTAYDAQKWEKAALAAEEVIMSSVYSLNSKITLSSGFSGRDPVYYTRWNPEVIWGRNRSIGGWIQNCMPRSFRSGYSYGGVGVSINMVDAYPMANGRYPIKLDGAKYRRVNGVLTPNIDELSGYRESGFTEDWSHPIDGAQTSTPNMCIDRDARFYVNTFWSGQKVTYSTGNKTTQYYYNGGDGPGLSHDYCPTGFGNRKLLVRDFNINSSSGSGYDVTWPLLRLSEIYLIYAEAMNEFDPGNSLILQRLNAIRARWGTPGLDKAYPEIDFASPASQPLVRELIKRERQVELYAESGQRYFDIRRWMDYENMILDIYGMNVFATSDSPIESSDEYFWRRTLIESRPMNRKFYLYPMAQTEMSNNKGLVQNYGY